MTESRQLLAEFVQRGSDEAFRELVRRYIDLVYSTALRLVAGNRSCAEDVTQTVFVHLSRTAHRLPPDVMLGGWLHRDTCHAASNLLRAERRRKAREKEVALMESTPDHSQANLALVAPILDEAIDALTEADRTAVLLRFFEQKDFRTVGQVLGGSEDGARMRVSRALEKLQRLLTKRGVALSTTALAAGLTGEAVSAAPAGLAATIAGAALVGSATVGAGAAAVTSIKVIAMTKIQAAVFAAFVLGVAGIPLWIQHQNQLRMAEENRALRQQLDQLTAQNEQLSNQISTAAATPAKDTEQQHELLKLRGEVAGLKRDLASAEAKAKAPRVQPAPEQQRTLEEQATRALAIAKLNYAKGWMLAFMQYAQQHGDQLPADFESAVAFAPDSVTNQMVLSPEQFEIVYNGKMTEITNPASLIVVREKDAWQTPDGGWSRGYGFADGHSEIHKANDGNFQPWEAHHMIPPPPATPGQ